MDNKITLYHNGKIITERTFDNRDSNFYMHLCQKLIHRFVLHNHYPHLKFKMIDDLACNHHRDFVFTDSADNSKTVFEINNFYF